MSSDLLEKEKLLEFLERAGKATYAGGGKYEENPERPEFHELVYQEGDLSYRDSYTGYVRSWGGELYVLKANLYGHPCMGEAWLMEKKKWQMNVLLFLKKH